MNNAHHPTALMHEAWLRLAGSDQQTWENRAHFFGAAAEAMRGVHIGHSQRLEPQSRGQIRSAGFQAGLDHGESRRGSVRDGES
jgi:hypothetical protein